jgi:hypothetical protein
LVDYTLYDVIEMKKSHPCETRSKLFQIVRLGADIKIKCLGCGRILMIDRAEFNDKIKKVISHNEGPVPIAGQK